MKDFFGKILCCAGFHNYRNRTNTGATEKICMRWGCEHREIYTVKKYGSVKMFREHKNPLVKRIKK